MDINLSDRIRIRKFGKVRFRCRLQLQMNNFYSTHLLRFSKSCRWAVARFARAIMGGKIHIQERSKFLVREDKNDKVSRTVILTRDIKDWMEKFSFSEKISQNEVLRMALEWWMETVNPLAKSRTYRAACRKWHHDHIQTRLEEFFFSFWQYGRERYEKFPTMEEAQKGIIATNPLCKTHIIVRGKVFY